MKAAKDMKSQFLVRELAFWYRDVGNDPTPINMGKVHLEDILCCRRRCIFPPNNSPHLRCRIISYDKPEPNTIDCWVTKEISRYMALKIFIWPSPSRSGLGVIRAHEEKQEMEAWTRYNVVAMLYHRKLEKIKTHSRNRRHDRHQYIFYVMKMDCNIPMDFIK